MAITELWIPSPHYSTSRGPFNKIAFHTTEGAMKIRDLGAWFQNPAAQCSSHHGADNYEAGLLGAYVYENYSAWTQGNANAYCLSLEMCAYASWSRDTWLNQKNTLLNNSADWLRYCVDKYNIPWTVLNNTQAQDPEVRGICQHINFGSWGSGHVDCGSGFPMDEVIKRAQGGSASAVPSGGGEFMAASTADGAGRLWFACIWKDGRVCIKPPEQGWRAIDPTQSGAKGGADIYYNAQDDVIVTTYINAAGNVCTYHQPATGGDSVWTNRGGEAKG
jgi:hypothetical protein